MRDATVQAVRRAAAQRAAAQLAAERALCEFAQIENEDDLASVIAEVLVECLPVTPKLVQAVKALVEKIEWWQSGYREMEAVGAHIAVRTEEHPGGRVKFDAADNLVAVEFDGEVHLS